MKKIIFFFACCISATSWSQVEYMHSFGGSIFYDIDYYQGGWEGITYQGRLNLTSFGPFVLDIDARPGAGIYYDDYYGGYIGFDVPVAVSINSGFGSASGRTDGVGFFLGAGFDYDNLINYWITYGPFATGGVRFWFIDQPFEINASYIADVSEENSKLIQIGIAYLLNFQ